MKPNTIVSLRFRTKLGTALALAYRLARNLCLKQLPKRDKRFKFVVAKVRNNAVLGGATSPYDTSISPCLYEDMLVLDLESHDLRTTSREDELGVI